MILEKLRVSDLKVLLAERGLDEHGKKSELVARLRAGMETDDTKTKTENKTDTDDTEKDDKDEDLEETEEDEKEEDSNDEDSSETPSQDGVFKDKEFISKKPEGISFELHSATVKKPQPKERTTEIPEEKPEVGVWH